MHAWFNPYRVGLQDPDVENLADDHPVRQNPEWLVDFGTEAYVDPGNPEVREWVTSVIMDVVERYDIDGMHFDDFFYPYPKDGATFDDDASWEAHGGDFDDRGDWRRENVNQLMRDVHGQIQETKPWVSFGVSPFGIWRNDSTDPTGSPARGCSPTTPSTRTPVPGSRRAPSTTSLRSCTGSGVSPRPTTKL